MSAATLVDLKSQHDRAVAAADEIISRAERQKRPLSHVEDGLVTQHTDEATAIGGEIKRLEFKALRHQFPSTGLHITNSHGHEQIIPKTLSAAYQKAFYDGLSSGSLKPSAAMVEGTGSAGGFAVPIEVDSRVASLAPQDFAVRQLATTIPTTKDIKCPNQTVVATATAKTEGSTFTKSSPTIGQFLLSAFVVGGVESDISLELAQDAPLFVQEFVFKQDIANAVQEAEEAKFLSGSGTGEPQGLLGNVGAGVTEEPDSNGNLVSIDGTLNLLATLKEKYHRNASWLMSRLTCILIRKAQVGTNLFEPAFQRVDGVDLLHGYRIGYAAGMPVAARGATPVLFGDFASAYVVGDRGGSALRVKVCDQTQAALGIITLFAYRRCDGRVRLAEAVQSYTIAAS